MELQKFIENFAAQFDETDASEFAAGTEFKTLSEWTSLMALSVIAMVDDEYEVAVKGNDIKTATTIEDLFEIVKSRM
ncbi:MAG: acyl carrier protein [Prevotellaceae bacterium]|jgi:acyl carrier protein|nr:acyl carrier protein [Prevotellaceae bacterium]